MACPIPSVLYQTKGLPAAQAINIYVGAGQSNFQGNALISGFSGQYQSNILNTNIWTGSRADGLIAGVNNQGVDSLRAGPELSFGVAKATAIGKTIGLVKWAVGGTTLAVDWVAGTGPQYVTLKARVQAALNYWNSNNYIPTIKGFLWMQGESDAQTLAYANAYNANLQAFIAQFKTDFASSLSGSFVFAIGGLGAISYTYTSTVQAAQAAVGALGGNATFTNTDLTLQGDGLHFDSPAQTTLGTRFSGVV